MTRLILLFTALVLTFGLGTPLIADSPKEPQTVPMKVNVGNFHELNIARQIKLGTAYYVNPRLVHQAVVSYAHPVAPILISGQAEDLYDLVIDGRVAFAKKYPGGTYKVVSPEQAVEMGLIDADDFTAFEESLKKSDIKVVSHDKVLFGIERAIPIVSWEPTEWFPSDAWKASVKEWRLPPKQKLKVPQP